MGLFGFGKKNKVVQEKAAEAVEYNKIAEKVNIKEQSYTNDESRRCFMMVEEAFPAKDNEGIVTVGMMRGTIKNGDAVYLLEPGDQIRMVNVIGLAVEESGEMKPVEEAKNRITGVKIYDIAGKKNVAKYAVLSSVKPQMNRKDPSSIENPYVWGLSYGYQKFIKDKDYFNLFISELLMANVLVPMQRGKEGYAVIGRPGESGRGDMLVFTDKIQLMLGDWNKNGAQENAGDQQSGPRVAVMRFADCIDTVCSQNGNISCIVCNAYGQHAVILSKKILDTIYQSDEFQRILKEKRE